MIDEKKLDIDDLCQICRSADCANCFSSDDFKKWIDSQPKVGEWVPVSEELPEIEKEVLVQWRPYLSSDIEMNILVLTKSGEWVCGLGRINGRAIAWMPLPEPYKEQNEDAI